MKLGLECFRSILSRFIAVESDEDPRAEQTSAMTFLELFEEFKSDTGARLTGILLDKGECFDFSLQKFADTIYRTSELMEDTIVERTIQAFS